MYVNSISSSLVRQKNLTGTAALPYDFVRVSGIYVDENKQYWFLFRGEIIDSRYALNSDL